MFSLLLLASVLLAFGGPVDSTKGLPDQAAELKSSEDLINRIILYQRQLKEEVKKRRQEQAQYLEGNNRQSYNNFAEEPPQQKKLDALQKDIDLQVNDNRENNGDTNQDPVTTTETTHQLPENPGALSQGQSGTSESPADKRLFFMIVIGACSVAGLIGLIMAGVCWYKLHSRVKAASDVDYPAYGVTGPTKERLPSPGDRKLAQSAQMYHYQHQKQQMIAMEKANGEMKQDASEDESEEENEEGDYTVYECPGLAPTGEMEVRNPLFTEESTPVNGQPPPINGIGNEHTAE